MDHGDVVLVAVALLLLLDGGDGGPRVGDCGELGMDDGARNFLVMRWIQQNYMEFDLLWV